MVSEDEAWLPLTEQIRVLFSKTIIASAPLIQKEKEKGIASQV